MNVHHYVFSYVNLNYQKPTINKIQPKARRKKKIVSIDESSDIIKNTE